MAEGEKKERTGIGDENLHSHEQSFIKKYIFSKDHKTIGKQYLITGIFMAILGGALAIFFRINL